MCKSLVFQEIFTTIDDGKIFGTCHEMTGEEFLLLVREMEFS